MKSWLHTFNWILLVATLMFAAGCETTRDPASDPTAKKDTKSKRKEKEVSTVIFYLETAPQGKVNSAPIYRKNPIYVPVESQPFLTLANVEEASVVDYLDGFIIQIRFDSHGAFVLDTISSANKGRRIAVFAKFPEPRWLAAPQITQRNATGLLSFTPDATREESERFVRGLNSALKTIRRRDLF